jgi:hypothetical protein
MMIAVMKAAVAATAVVPLLGVSAVIVVIEVIVAARVKEVTITVGRITTMARLCLGLLHLGTNRVRVATRQATVAILVTAVTAVLHREWGRPPVFPEILSVHLLDFLEILMP